MSRDDGPLFAAEPYPIEDGIAIPEDRQAGQRIKWDTNLYPFARLRVGQSFKVNKPAMVDDIIRVQNHVSGAACSYRKRFHEEHPGEPWDFTTRSLGNYVRCWRTE